MEPRVRLQELRIEDFQNVSLGEVQFPCNTRERFFGYQSDVLGIYGQNGSGKTALIHAIAILKSALDGKPVGRDAAYYIAQGKPCSVLSAVFSLQRGRRSYRLEYEAVLKRGETSSEEVDSVMGCTGELPGQTAGRVVGIIAGESLKYSEAEGENWKSRKTLGEWRQDGELLSPKKSLSILSETGSSAIDDLRLAKKLSLRQGTSFLFSEDMERVVMRLDESNPFRQILPSLREYAHQNLYIIGSGGWGAISLNKGLPFHFRVEEPMVPGSGKNISMGAVLFRLDSPTVFPNDFCPLLEKAIISLNEILFQIVPGMRLKLRRLGTQILSDGREAVVTEPVTTREGTGQQIPLRYESEGIKKIISMLGMYMAAYRSPVITLAIDELDAGIHEYLLGELLAIFQEGGKGQLIFTSHNLRPLERLDKRSIVFTASDPAHRYVRMKNIKANNNLRDVYYSAILWGRDKGLYDAAGIEDLRKAIAPGESLAEIKELRNA